VYRSWVCTAADMLCACALVAHPCPGLARAIAALLAQPVNNPRHSPAEYAALVHAAWAAGLLQACEYSQQLQLRTRSGAVAAADSTTAEGYMGDLHSIVSGVLSRLSNCPRGSGGAYPLGRTSATQLMQALLLATAVKDHPATIDGLHEVFPEVATSAKKLVRWCDPHWSSTERQHGKPSSTQQMIAKVGG
jgi:hypothetical protein